MNAVVQEVAVGSVMQLFIGAISFVNEDKTPGSVVVALKVPVQPLAVGSNMQLFRVVTSDAVDEHVVSSHFCAKTLGIVAGKL